MMTPSDAAFVAIVHGRVQGVGFRYHTRAQAVKLGLTGYVRNLFDGTVEVVCEGDPSALDRMKQWLGHGPAGARVTALDVRQRTPLGTYGSFSIEF
jgi:acylphosphatase